MAARFTAICRTCGWSDRFKSEAIASNLLSVHFDTHDDGPVIYPRYTDSGDVPIVALGDVVRHGRIFHRTLSGFARPGLVRVLPRRQAARPDKD